MLPRTPGPAPQPLRDEHDTILTRAALERGLPLFAICRGAQILNVAFDGSLTQHLPDINPTANYQPAPGVFGEAAFTTAPGSLIQSLLGDAAGAPCYHHQAMETVPPGLRVTASSEDGTVQAWRLTTPRLGPRRAVPPGTKPGRPAAVPRLRPGRGQLPCQPKRDVHDMTATTFDVINPSTEEVIETVSLAGLAEVDAAIARAAGAFASWRGRRPGGPRAAAAALRRGRGRATWNTWPGSRSRNAGHTIGNARWEAGNVRDVLDYYSAAPERHFGKQIPVAGGVNITFHEPLGVVGVIVPWNFPMPIAAWGFAPALAAGNTVVLKPAEMTPLTALRLAELAREAGIPDGVFQVIPGKGSVVGERFVAHPAVRKVVFTGSTGVGKRIMAGCADQVKRVTLELGGKSANIVFADADLEMAAADRALRRCFDNAGQDCCARSRILVQRNVL